MLLSLFCGAGGLDLGFERAGFNIGLAFDKKADSIASYNHNRSNKHAFCMDVRELSLDELDSRWGGTFAPDGVVGGPPCQSFSQANRSVTSSDPRHELPLVYARIVRSLNERSALKFIALENVPGLNNKQNTHHLEALQAHLEETGFTVFKATLNARDYSTPQSRRRLFVVGLNSKLYPGLVWNPPAFTTDKLEKMTVRAAIGALPEPRFFGRTQDAGLTEDQHPNHWCMNPKSKRFLTPGALTEGDSRHRSFKTLAWDKPSLTVAYGNREVHVHPSCKRRLSVYEAMLLQGFPVGFELLGSLSSQIAQVSEAVPPTMAEAVARSINDTMERALDFPLRPAPGQSPQASSHELLPT